MAREALQSINVRHEMTRRRSPVGKAIDMIGNWLAQPLLFVLLFAFHVAWVIVNLGVVPGVRTWDPPPFTLLATIASVEAPFLALLILMRQQRDGRISELRQELILQVALDLDDKVSRQNGEDGIEPEHLLDRLRRQLDEEEGKMQGEEDER